MSSLASWDLITKDHGTTVENGKDKVDEEEEGEVVENEAEEGSVFTGHGRRVVSLSRQTEDERTITTDFVNTMRRVERQVWFQNRRAKWRKTLRVNSSSPPALAPIAPDTFLSTSHTCHVMAHSNQSAIGNVSAVTDIWRMNGELMMTKVANAAHIAAFGVVPLPSAAVRMAAACQAGSHPWLHFPTFAPVRGPRMGGLQANGEGRARKDLDMFLEHAPEAIRTLPSKSSEPTKLAGW